MNDVGVAKGLSDGRREWMCVVQYSGNGDFNHIPTSHGTQRVWARCHDRQAALCMVLIDSLGMDLLLVGEHQMEWAIVSFSTLYCYSWVGKSKFMTLRNVLLFCVIRFP